MTRLAILSDIHGNLPALEAIIADIAAFKVDHVVVSGDLINVGPFSVQVLERIAALNWAVIRGNHEFYLLDYGTPREPAIRRDYALPRWIRQIMPDAWYAYIAALPDSLTLFYPDATPIEVAHGIPGDHWKGIHPTTSEDRAARLLAHARELTVVLGHTHLPMTRHVRANGKLRHVLNPGSAGIPLDGKVGMASYMLLESTRDDWKPTFRRVRFNVNTVLAEFERIGFVEACGPTARLLVEEFRTANVRLVPFINWRRENYPDTPETMTMVGEFLHLPENEYWKYIPEYFRSSVPYARSDRHP
jgi:predicted phosphodiesterase